MARPRRDYLQRTHIQVDGWANWVARHLHTSIIGYPSRTAESRAGEGLGDGKPGSKSPEVMMPEHVAKVDHAVRVMPKDLYVTVENYYINTQKVPRRKLNEALMWLSGRIWS